MKTLLSAIIAALIPTLITLPIFADNYAAMWKKVEEAQKNDLPKTAVSALRQIKLKAEAEKQYGHLLKAQFMMSWEKVSVSPDSLDSELASIERSYDQATDVALKAVYASALGAVYKEYDWDDDNQSQKSKRWFQLSLADPAALAQEKSEGYEPALEPGVDSRIFYGDLLHVIGIAAEEYGLLRDYYEKAGNRTAACVCALKALQQKRPAYGNKNARARYLTSVDSLLKAYGDLREAGEIAIEHFDVASATDDTNPQELVSYINYALANWGAWPRMNILRNKLSDLQQPTFTINVGDYMMLPGKPRLLAINSIRNIQELYINVYKVSVDGNTKLDPARPKDYALQR